MGRTSWVDSFGEVLEEVLEETEWLCKAVRRRISKTRQSFPPLYDSEISSRLLKHCQQTFS